jgi:hypothetical protein
MRPARPDDGVSPGATTPLIHGVRPKLRLAAASMLVLGAGRIMAPRTPVPPGPEERAAPILEEAVDRREPARLFRPLQDAGRAAASYTVSFWREPRRRIETHPDFDAGVEERTPAAFGIRTNVDQVLTHVGALDGRRETRVTLADGSEVRARVRAYEARTGLVLLQLAGAAEAASAPLASAPPVAGALTVAAARFEGTDLLVPVFVGAVRPDRYTVEPVGGSLRPGMPIYALDGGALAIAGAGGSSAHPVADALARLGSLAGQDPSLPRTIGVCFQAITPALAAFVG